MKRRTHAFAVLLLILAMLLTFVACQVKEPPVENNPPTTTQAPETECTHSFTEAVEAEPQPLADGVKRFTCRNCDYSYTEQIPATKALKVLAIGNSFSTDATEYLWDIAHDGGVETLVVGNLYIGGCTLATHAANITSSANSYAYYKNVDGTWVKNEATSIQTALADEEWDVITLQQASGQSGIDASFQPPLEILLTKLAELEPNAKIYWHMTWAYQQTSSHKDFALYNKDQTTMYQAIVGAINSKIKTDAAFSGVIPAGTAIQNLRTSYLGDTLTRDGYHLSYEHGRYTAAMTWYAYLTGGAVDAVDWVPTEYAAVLRQDMDAIHEAVNAALAKPLEVTASSFENAPPSGPKPQSDAEYFASIHKDINDYNLLDWAPEVGAFYNCKTQYDTINSGYDYVVNYIATKHLTQNDLPVGSIILVDEGYSYRTEGWVAENVLSATRGNPTSTPIVEVTDAWWGNYTVCGMNLSAVPAKVMTIDDAAHLRIYIPKDEEEPTGDAALFAAAGLDINDYEVFDWAPEVGAFYNCKNSYAVLNSSNSTASNLVNFIASGYITLEDLPVGSVIIVDEGYNYRPEGWTAENVLSSARASSTTENFTVVDADWWGDFTIRGFNLGSSPAKVMTAEDATHLRIYVPKTPQQ